MNLLKRIQYALNSIPNQKGVGPKGESSYDLVSELSRYTPKVYLRLFRYEPDGSCPTVIFELHGFYMTYGWLIKLDTGPGQQDMIAFEKDEDDYFWYAGEKYSDFFVSATLGENETVTELQTDKMNK